MSLLSLISPDLIVNLLTVLGAIGGFFVYRRHLKNEGRKDAKIEAMENANALNKRAQAARRRADADARGDRLRETDGFRRD